MSDSEDTNDRRQARHEYRRLSGAALELLEETIQARHILVDDFSGSEEDLNDSSFDLEHLDNNFRSGLDKLASTKSVI